MSYSVSFVLLLQKPAVQLYNLFMRVFNKLSNVVEVGTVSSNTLHIRYGRENSNGQFQGIQYHTAAGEFRSMYQIIPEKYRQDFSPLVMSINRNIPPHTDSGILVTVNLYITAGQYETVFYQPNTNNRLITEKLHNQTNGSIFDINCLDRIDSFVALDGETYILDVTHPHGVYSLSADIKERTALVLQSRLHSYDDVCNMLAETGYIDR